MSPAPSARSPLALTLALVAMLAALGALAWFVASGSATRRFEAAKRAQVERAGDGGTELSADARVSATRSVETSGASSPAEASAVSSASGTGTLRLRVLDERTRAPVPDLAFVVYRERGGQKVLAKGSTDAQGRAELREIEANTVIVRTERKPPYAEQTGAVWLTSGATKELELLVGPGSAVVGRVVDDLGRPVEAAEIRIDRARDSEQPDARSGADGRFRVECLASRPVSVWIVDGEMRPEHWEALWLQASHENVWASASALPVAGQDFDVGDLVLARVTIFRGRLFDANGQRVAGAVLSRAGELPRGPADPGFQLGTGDVLTDAAGNFEFHAPGPSFVLVWTRAGQCQRLGLPAAKPGERVDGVELRLRPETVFELELVDASGARAPIPVPMTGSDGVNTPWRSSYFLGSDKVSILARTADGARARVGCEQPDPDGRWRAHLALDPREIGEFEVAAAGYAPVVERSESGFPALVQRTIAITPFPTFRLRLVRKEATRLLEGEGEFVHVQICRADPARRAAAGGGCCGLGAYWNGRWRGEPLDLVLPVRKDAPFWIYVRGPELDAAAGRMSSVGYAGERPSSGGLRDLVRTGPFGPGPDVHEIELDPADFVQRRQPEEARRPPAATTPGEDRSAHLRARFSDARTGKPVPGARVSMSELGALGKRAAGANADENGAIEDARVPAGQWKTRVDARGYLTVELGERSTREGETLDLGSIALEPRPRHRGKVLDADGAPLAQVWLGVLAGSRPVYAENGGMMTGPDGSFELIGELPPSFVLQASAPALHAGWGSAAQRFALEAWPEGEVKELRFARFRKVVVTLAGLDPEEAPLVPCACPAPGEPTATCDHRVPHVAPHERLARGLEIASSDAGSRFAFLLPPGRYVFSGQNVLHELPVTEFELDAGDTDVELTLRAN